jgi:hypothetical protein
MVDSEKIVHSSWFIVNGRKLHCGYDVLKAFKRRFFTTMNYDPLTIYYEPTKIPMS